MAKEHDFPKSKVDDEPARVAPRTNATGTARSADPPSAPTGEASPNPESEALLPGNAGLDPAKKADEAVPGGQYIRKHTVGRDGKLYGGEVVNAHGRVLATFDDKQVNTGNPKDGKKPPKPAPVVTDLEGAEPEE